MKILTNQKLNKLAYLIIELQKLIDECEIEPLEYIKMIDVLSNIARESLDMTTFAYVCGKIKEI